MLQVANKFRWRFIFMVLFAGFIFVTSYSKLRYFSADYHTVHSFEHKTSIIALRSSKSFECFDKQIYYKLLQKGRFWVLQNYIRANKWFACDQSVTLTTIGDPLLLENVKMLVEHWNGPISVALYTPGTDLEMALHLIKYLRTCYPSSITEYVSFHFFFEMEHKPQQIPSLESVNGLILESDLCTMPSPWRLMNGTRTYRAQMGLRFPINVGRNIARDGATTHFILASDIELFPSQNMIPEFLNMIRQNSQYLQATTPNVFVLPPFEVEENILVPSNKETLLTLLSNGSAVKFHRYFCSSCHAVPGYQIWLKANQRGGIHVIHTSKREGYWEPFYISTNDVPYFDERVDWEGRCNKLVQAYLMCVLGYDYHLLDNAFLVHKPGIKRRRSEADKARDKFAKQTVQIVRQEIEPEIHKLYGMNKNCTRITVC